MKRDIKYVIKRIIIGVGIALLLGFIRQNVYAYEWEVTDDEFIENNNTIAVTANVVNGYSRNTPRYPLTKNSTTYSYNLSYSYCQNYTGTLLETGGGGGGMSSFGSGYYGGYYYNSFIFSFNSPFALEKGTYYVVIPIGYNDTKSDFSYNEDLLLDNTIYSTNNSDINITSVVFSSGSNNPFICEDTFLVPNLMYFKVSFEVLNDTDGFTLYLGEDTSRTAVFTAFNTTTYSDYLYKFTSSTYDSNTKYYYRFYQPMFYKHNVGSIFPDVSTSIQDTFDDINQGVTNNIIDGVYTGNSVLEEIGSGGGGGMSFGNNNISDILIIPLTFLQKFNSDTICQPVTIPLPMFNVNFTLPCISTFISDITGNELFKIIQLIIGVGVGFKVGMNFYYTMLNILDPQKMITN